MPDTGKALGMYATLYQITPAQLERLRANPNQTEGPLDAEEGEFSG